MKICPNCQHENEADNVFCENCGADLTHIDSAERTQASGTEQKLGDSRQYQAHKPAKTQQSRWLRISGNVLAVVIIVGGGFGFYQYHTGKNQQIAAEVEMMTSNKPTTLSKHLVSDNTGLKITKQSVKPLMTYIQKHPQYAQDLKTDLQHNGYSSDHTFVVKQIGTKWTLFPTYKLRVTTMQPLITTNLKNATLEANDIELVTTESAHATYKVGSLFPGTYMFKLSNSDTTITHKVNLMGHANVHELISLVANKKAATTSTANTDTKATTASDESDSSLINSENESQSGTGSAYDDLSSSAQTAMSEIAAATGGDISDYDYTASEPHTDVYEIKCYVSGTNDLADTYRYDDVNDILARYNTSTGKFETVDSND